MAVFETVRDCQARELLAPPNDACQRQYLLGEVFNGLRSIVKIGVKTGAHWRIVPHSAA